MDRRETADPPPPQTEEEIERALDLYVQRRVAEIRRGAPIDESKLIPLETLKEWADGLVPDGGAARPE